MDKYFPSKENYKPWIFYESKGAYFFSTSSSGKWCIVSTPEEVDKDWEIIYNLVKNGKLVATKVSTLYAKNITKHKTHVICVYTKNWEDKEDVFKYRQVLKNAGFTQKLGYKRDMDTIRPNPNFEFYYED